jgi:hypothetical protein
MQKMTGGLGALLVLGLGMGLLRGGGGPQSGSAGRTGSTQRQTLLEVKSPPDAGEREKGKLCAAKDLLDTIEAFSPQPSSSDDLCKSGHPLDDEFKNLAARGNEINFAIAIVPDPKHTHLSLFFDRTIDAIQQGAQEAQWIFDRATMPWDSQEHPESTDFRIRLQQGEYEGSKEDLPGLMIFRRDNPDNLRESLFVLVVGETPTGGVNKTQFGTAVQLIADVAKTKNAVSKNPLRIIGPTFSGSLYSLAQLISDAVPASLFSGVVIRSGTVSSWNTTQWFRNWFEQRKSHGAVTVDFATFQNSDSYMLRKFIEFEKRRGYAPDKIAVLAEDETAYGNIGFRTGTAVANHSSKTPDVEALRKDEDSVLHLYFPRDISQLRSAYQQGLQTQASPSTDSYQVRTTLPLNLQDTGSDDDSVQHYAHSQTPLSQESILLGIIAAIRQHHIQFVVLQATNPIDTVFLSGFLKKGYSQARVVAMPADLLLSRDADDVSLLHGVMALTTYSLLPGIKDEVAIPNSLPEARVSHIFPSAYATGTYNATLSQISCFGTPSPEGCKLGRASTGLPVAHYAEYGWPLLAGPKNPPPLRPVVWLAVLGRDGFWPVAILEDGNFTAGNIPSMPKPIAPATNEASAQTSERGKFAPPWPLFWKIFCGLVLLLVVVFWVLLRYGSIMAGSSAMTLLAPVKDPCRPTLIALIGWLLLSAMLLLVWPCVGWVMAGVKMPTALSLLAIILIAAIFAGIHCWVCIKELNRRDADGDSRLFLRVAVVIIVFFVLLYLLPGHSQNPFLYRYVHLTSGVSPLLPLLCLLAAGLWWAWFSLSGLALLDERHPRLPKDSDLPEAVPAGHTASALAQSMWPAEGAAERLVAIARPCARNLKVYVPAFALAAVGLFGLDYGHPLLSLETRHFEWAYAIGLGAVTLAVFGTLFRMLVIWTECRRILTTLDHFPLRRAFGLLNLTWAPFWRLGGARWQDLYRLISRQLETLEHLKREVEAEGDDAVSEELVENIKSTAAAQDTMRSEFLRAFKPVASEGIPAPEPPGARNSISRISFAEAARVARETEFSDSLIKGYRDLQEKIAKTCAAALKYLQPKWWDEEGLIVTEVACGEDIKKDEDAPELSLSTRLAERFVALVYLNFILSVILRMRTLAITVGGLYIFLLLSVNSYPFEPKVSLRSAAIFLLMFIVGIVGFVSAQVHRDSILSLVTQTKPGELGIAFWVRMGTFVALPLISLVVSQFPTLNNALFSWLEPAVNALK